MGRQSLVVGFNSFIFTVVGPLSPKAMPHVRPDFRCTDMINYCSLQERTPLFNCRRVGLIRLDDCSIDYNMPFFLYWPSIMSTWDSNIILWPLCADIDLKKKGQYQLPHDTVWKMSFRTVVYLLHILSLYSFNCASAVNV